MICGFPNRIKLHLTYIDNSLAAILPPPLSGSYLVCATLSQVLKVLEYQRRPAGLMAGANSPARVPVEVLIEEDETPPMGILSILFHISMARPTTIVIRQKDSHQTTSQQIGRAHV